MKKMNLTYKQPGRLLGVLLTGLVLALPWGQANAQHDIRGITGPTFNLYAFPFNMNLPEGTSLHMWGFGDVDAGTNATHTAGNGYGLPQYPGPTLVVNEGDTVTINLLNSGVPQPVSIVVTGHDVASSCVTNVNGDCNGLVTEAAEVDEEVSYTFTASEPGTYIYHSLDGSNPGLHVEMGLLGVLIVRPADLIDTASGKPTAYGDGSGTDYDQEFLSLLTEIDPDIHLQVERGHITHFTNADRFAKVWFVNGRVFPDLFQGDYNPIFPHQPYESLAQAHPRDRVLVRQVNAGQDSHPFHFHGENLRFIARDGRILSSNGTFSDLGRSDNTINSAPKQTIDAIWEWNAKQLGWDIYGHVAHDCEDTDGDGFGDGPGTTFEGEWCDDHNKPFPVDLPGVADLALGGWWSGSPFLGDTGGLPPGEGGLNPNGGYFFVWHSHAEKELTTFDIFPGGSLGAVVVLPPGTTIE
jgi:FtsP/CotA-like multicopper oxidase with cupredoxin domain